LYFSTAIVAYAISGYSGFLKGTEKTSLCLLPYSLILVRNSYLKKSKAVLKIASLLGGVYKVSALGKIIPSFLSDKIYDVVSKNRMKLANQKCYLPTPHQRAKFIQV